MTNTDDELDEILDKLHCCGQKGTLNMEDDSDRQEFKQFIKAEITKARIDAHTKDLAAAQEIDSAVGIATVIYNEIATLKEENTDEFSK